MGQITLICGSARSQRSSDIDDIWRRHCDTAVLLTPTARLARARQSAFVRVHQLPGLLGSRAWELSGFARAIVEASGRHVRMVSMLERRMMVRKALEELPSRPDITRPEISPGLVRHLLHVITELKQAAVEPGAFRKAIGAGGQKGVFDGLVAAVYEHYQSALLAEDRYDVPGLYWEAERCCVDAPALPNSADTILLDGFDDFTLSQQRFLAALSRRATRMVIGLHYDENPDRSDLFRLQQRWVEKFTASMSVETRYVPTEPPQDYIQHMARYLFWRNPPPSPALLRANARIVPCADAQHEMEYIGRQVKRHIRNGVAPQTIAVCLADMEPMAAPLGATFSGFGIPVSMRVAPSLLTTAVGAFVMRIFEALDTWERTTVTSLLASPLFYRNGLRNAADGSECAGEKDARHGCSAPYEMAFPLLSRQAGIVMGRDEWKHAVEWLEQQMDAGSETQIWNGMAIPQPAETLALFRERLCWLEALADAMPEEAHLHAFARLLDARLEEIGMASAAAAMPDPAIAQREVAAVRVLHGLLEQIAGATDTDTAVSRDEFARFLQDAFGDARVRVPDGSGPGVYCCGLDGLRHEQFDYVFLGGLNEGVLPRPAPVNAVYSESDLNRLRRLNLDLPGRYEHTQRERLLFCHAVNAARQELVLSWRNQDTSGRDALPGPFVVDIADMFKAHGLDDIALPPPGPDCFVPEPLLAASKRDLANVACYRAFDFLLEPLASEAEPLKRVIAIETDRNSTAPFGIYDGCIASSDLLEMIASRYGEAAQFSVNQLEGYIKFPFQFFVERILRIRETSLPDTEMDARTRGSIAHEALYRFHKRFAGVSVAALLGRDESGARAAMRDCMEAAFRSHEQDMLSVPDAVVRIERSRLDIVLDRYLTRAAEDFGSDLAPGYFEATFGRAPGDADEDLRVKEPFPLTIGDKIFRLTGKIDRIDTDGETARIIDYKSSALPAVKDIKSGLDLQLTVYAWALEQHLLPGVICRDACYYSVYKIEKREALFRKKEDDFEQREENARRRIAEAVHGIRAGQFPPLLDESVNSNRTPPHTAARYEEWRIERKCPARCVADDDEE